MLTSAYRSNQGSYELQWYSPELQNWVVVIATGGGAMTAFENALYMINENEILKLAIARDIGMPLFFDSFESGDLNAWSAVSQ